CTEKPLWRQASRLADSRSPMAPSATSSLSTSERKPHSSNFTGITGSTTNAPSARKTPFVKDEIRYRSGASIERLDSPDRTCRRYHCAFAFTSNQDLKMAQPLPGMKPRPDQ